MLPDEDIPPGRDRQNLNAANRRSLEAFALDGWQVAFATSNCHQWVDTTLARSRQACLSHHQLVSGFASVFVKLSQNYYNY